MSQTTPLHILLVGEAGPVGEALKSDLDQSGGRLLVEPDLPNTPEEVEALFKKAGGGLDRLDGVVLALPSTGMETSIEPLAPRLRTLFHVVQQAAKAMVRARNGALVAVLPAPGEEDEAGGLQAATNAAATGLLQSVARELAGRNLRANVVSWPADADAAEVAGCIRFGLEPGTVNGQVLTPGLELTG